MSGLGASGAPLHDVTVQAENWMTALRNGRTQIGEQGGVPTGASCAVAPDGKVTILDPAAQRTYVVTTVKTGESMVPPAAAPAAPAELPSALPALAAAAMPANAPIDPKAMKRTMAYEMPNVFAQPGAPQRTDATSPIPLANPLAAPIPLATPAAAPMPLVNAPVSTPAPVKASQLGVNEKIAAATAAYVTPANGSVAPPPAVAPLVGTPIVPGPAPVPTFAQPANAPTEKMETAPASSIEISPEAYVPSEPPPAPLSMGGPVPVGLAPEPSAPIAAVAGVRAQLLSERSDEPTAENPLTYRERTLVVPEDTPLNVCEQIIREELARVQLEIAESAPGKFINLALFDHPWSKRPLRRPLVTLQWKDWRGDPEVVFPPRTPPTMVPPGMSIPPVANRVRRTSAPPAEQDERLANAFEACQDLFFLTSAAEGLEFVVRLIRETVPCEATTSALYDINTDEFRLVALDGPGAGERRGDAIPSNAGLIGAAAASIGVALVVDDVGADPRFDPGIDGRIGVEPRNMMLYALVHERRLLGMLQLVNRAGRDYFGRGDVNVVTYIGKQLTEFLHAKRIEEQESQPSGKGSTRGKRR